MKTITIEGKFKDSVNNFVILDVFRPNSQPDPYDFRKSYDKDFTQTLTDLQSELIYNIDFTGFTTGKFTLKILGNFDNPNPVIESFENDTFSPGYTILTN